MAKFKYKFESIKKVKESLEKKAQKEVAVIDLEIEKLKQSYIDVEKEGLDGLRKNESKNVSVAELKFEINYKKVIQNRLIEIQKNILKMEKLREKKIAELIQKSKEHKMFDALEETHLEIFMHEQNKNEMLFIDEIATQKFNRDNK
jgi:flagellar export protein FliJ